MSKLQEYMQMMHHEMMLIKRNSYSQTAAANGYIVEFRSQYGEDMLAWDMLYRSFNGTYVEVGGFDGLSYSVSSAFDDMRWCGVLIEANPVMFQKSLANRPSMRCHKRHLAIGAVDNTTVDFDIPVGAGMFAGISTTRDTHGNAYVDALPVNTISVPSCTMDRALELAADIETYDLAVIDVEGGEIELLKGFNLNRWKPRVVIIEDNSLGKDKSMDPFFAADYLLFAWIGSNRVYARTDAEVVMRFCRPME